jgi:hypothetical protein
MVASARTGPPNVSPTDLRLGLTCCSENLAGDLDDVAIYAQALPAERIAAHYALGTGQDQATVRNRSEVRRPGLDIQVISAPTQEPTTSPEEPPARAPSPMPGMRPEPRRSPGPGQAPRPGRLR